MRIGIDTRYLSHGIMGGINSYLQNLLPALFDVAEGHSIFLYADTKMPFELADLPAHVILKLLPYRNAISSFFLDFSLNRVMAADHIDIAHFPANYGFGPKEACTAITLHDEINIMPLQQILKGHPKKAQTIIMMTYLHFCTRQAIKRANQIFTISEYARKQILRWGLLPEEKVVVIPHGKPSDAILVKDDAELGRVRQLFKLKKEFVLADALKNPGVLVRAWERLPDALRKEKEIVFYSRSENVRADVHRGVDAGFAKFLVRPGRRELNALYSMADVFVFPSWIEGFGIPLLEAMACGAPIIASDRGAIPEVMGGAGLIIDAEDDAALADRLVLLFTNRDERERIRKLGFERVKMFTWEASATQLLKTYQRIITQN
jgi:glycosyltransferase involved in cell wall biosynthesis